MTTLILRKLLASSSSAIAGTLETMKERLVKIRDGQPADENLAEQIIVLEELEDDYLDEMLDLPESTDSEQPADIAPKIDLAKLKLEIIELERFIAWAHSIGVDSKSHALLKALEIGFAEMAKTGAARKALVFTESRRTQEHLRSFLEANGHTGRVIIFNGTNTDPAAKAIYEKWLATNAGNGRASGSRSVDITGFCSHNIVRVRTFVAPRNKQPASIIKPSKGIGITWKIATDLFLKTFIPVGHQSFQEIAPHSFVILVPPKIW